MQWTFGILCLGCLCQVFVFDRLANLMGLCMAYQISFLLMIVRDLTKSLCNLVPLYFSTLYFVLLCLCKFLSWEICTSCFDLKSQIPTISNWKVSFLGNCCQLYGSDTALFRAKASQSGVWKTGSKHSSSWPALGLGHLQTSPSLSPLNCSIGLRL